MKRVPRKVHTRPVAHRRHAGLQSILLIQGLVIAAFAVSWCLLPDLSRRRILAELQQRPLEPDVTPEHNLPTRIDPLYDDPTVVSDAELAAVLKKLLPRFSAQKLRPNYVEHALRTWGAQIEFSTPELISGPHMVEFLTDSSVYLRSWGDGNSPILQPDPQGIAIRWGSDRSASVHHDHLLASLTEAGVALDTPVFTPRGRRQFRDVLRHALADFRLDERETEWSVMAFGFWLAPQGTASWHNADGRAVSMDLLAERLMRSHRKQGVCLGTHRAFSLVALLRLDESSRQRLITEETRKQTLAWLAGVRDLICLAQSPDGSWPPDWTDGAAAASRVNPLEKPHRRVISTGHHLEWLAIAPQDLHPPREQIRRAAAWAIRNTVDTPQSEIDANYTFYSHVANGLALWRKTTPARFWTDWRNSHPEAEVLEVLPDHDQPILEHAEREISASDR